MLPKLHSRNIFLKRDIVKSDIEENEHKTPRNASGIQIVMPIKGFNAFTAAKVIPPRHVLSREMFFILKISISDIDTLDFNGQSFNPPQCLLQQAEFYYLYFL